MKLICPTLKINDNFSVILLKDIIVKLENKDDPFFILEKDEMNYMQTCYYKKGFFLEYQEGSINNHYISTDILSKEVIINSFIEYSKNNNKWKLNLRFKNKKINYNVLYKLGFSIGKFISKPVKKILDFKKGFVMGYTKAKKKKIK